MKKISKKALALLLSLLMLCSAFAALPFTASAAQTNLALNATAEADVHEAETDSDAGNAIDGDEATRWTTTNDTNAHYITLTFEEPQTVGSLKIIWERDNVTGFQFQYEEEGTWKDAHNFSGTGSVVQTIVLEKSVTASKFRLNVTAYSTEGKNASGTNVSWANFAIYELELYKENAIAKTLSEIAASLEMPELDENDTTLPMPNVPEGYTIKINGVDYEQVIDAEGNIRHPLNDTDVKVSFVVSDEEDSAVSIDYEVTVPGVAEGDVPKEANEKPAVIPELAEWQGGTGDYTLPDKPTIYIDDTSEVYKAFTEKEKKYIDGSAKVTTDDFLDITGKTVEVVKGDGKNAKTGDIIVKFSNDINLGDEGYKMVITDKIEITAEAQTGFFWATRSILQILKQNGTTIPQGTTYDYPRFPVRTFVFDVGRSPVSLETLYNVMMNMAWYKMNDLTVHLYDNLIFFEDHVPADERNGTDFSKAFEAYDGFRIESNVENEKTGEKLTSQDRYYSKEEFRDFIQVSRCFGVDVVPEFDSPAHSLSIVRVFPEYGIQEWGGSHATYLDHLDLAKPEVTQFLKDLWKEYTEGENPVFDEDTIIDIGGDEYTYNIENYRKFMDEMIKFTQNDLDRTVRIWGSLTRLAGNTPITSENVQMLVWNSGWANPKSMYDQGYDLIHVLDGASYIVPGAGYYYDYIDPQGKYNSYDPSKFGDTSIPSGDDQMLGGGYALWMDMIDTRERGITDYDIFDRFFKPLVGYSSKLWGDASDLTYAQAASVFSTTSTAPNTNPYYDVDVEDDVKVNYDFKSDSAKITDTTGNGHDAKNLTNASVVNEQSKNSLKLNGGESYAETDIDFFGEGTELSFSAYRSSYSAEEQILFETSDKFETWAIKAVQKDTGKVGFSREKCDFSFNYTLPVGEWVNLKIVGHKDTADLYVNGALVDTVGTKVSIDGNTDLHATLMIPFARIGSKTNAFKGLIADLNVTQKSAEVNAFDPNDSTIIERKDFEVSSDNYYNSTAEGPPSLAFDGNTATIWHSNYSPYDDLPASVTINMKSAHTIDKFTYIPRQSGTNGIVTKYTLSYSNNGTDWTELITEGTLEGDSSTKTISFEPVSAQYVKFTAIEGMTSGDNMFASAAEMYVHETKETVASGYVTVNAGEHGNINLNGASSQARLLGVKEGKIEDAVQVTPQNGYVLKGFVDNNEKEYASLSEVNVADGVTEITAIWDELPVYRSVIIRADDNTTISYKGEADLPSISLIVEDGGTIPEGIEFKVEGEGNAVLGFTDANGNTYKTLDEIKNITADIILTVSTGIPPKEYTVTVNAGEHGSITVDGESVESVQIPVAIGNAISDDAVKIVSEDGYILVGWSVDDKIYASLGDITPEGDITVTAVWALLGDVDGDGDITSMDATGVLQHVALINVIPDDRFAAANVDYSNDVIDTNDATCILQKIAGIITSF